MRRSRRDFLKAAAVAPALAVPQTPTQPRVTTIRNSSFDPWVEIDAARLRHNIAAIHRRANRPILAVIKNNGYGCGVANVARLLEPIEAIAGFAVVKLHEAMTLRDAGITKPVLLMGGAMYPIIASVSASHTIVEIGSQPRVKIGEVATIFDAQEGSRLEDLASSFGGSVYDLTMHLHANLPRRVV